METGKGSNDNSVKAQEQSVETLDNQEQVDKKQLDRTFGAKILSQANFESRHQPIVGSSFNKARQHGEKLPGKNNERRNYSYLSRIERLVEKHGNRLEKRLWDKSADQLIISPEDITDDYWQTQEHIFEIVLLKVQVGILLLERYSIVAEGYLIKHSETSHAKPIFT